MGTSGWAYNWNEKQSLDWYIAESGLNAVELNMSFYRFPSAAAVKSWTKKGSALRWSIKVNRLITHTSRFGEKAWGAWERFRETLAPLDGYVDFYLFQLPPSLTPKTAPAIGDFAAMAGLGERFALEVRNAEWFSKQWVRWASDLGVTLVSVDAPELPRDVFCTDGLVYVRMHGRTGWYSHDYSRGELAEVAANIRQANPRRGYVFFNNDHAMLENGRVMRRILREPAL